MRRPYVFAVAFAVAAAVLLVVLLGRGHGSPGAPPLHAIADPVEDAVYEADVMFDDIRTAIENFAPEQVLEEFTEDFSGDTPFDAAAAEPQKRYDPFGVESFALVLLAWVRAALRK